MKRFQLKKCIFVLLYAVCICTAFAENSDEPQKIVFTFEDAVKTALEQNPELERAEIDFASAARNKLNSWNNFLPSFSLSAGGSAKHDFENGSFGNFSWSGSAGLSLGLNANIPAKMALTNTAYEISLASYKKQQAELIASVASSFYSLINSQKNLEILEDSRNLAKQLYEQSMENYRSGLASELALLQSEYAYRSTAPQITSAQSAYKSSLEKFKQILGLSSETEVELEGSIELKELSLPSHEKLVEEYTQNRYDVVLKKLALEQAKLQKASATAQAYAPSINLSEKFSLSEKKVGSGVGESGGFTGTFNISVSIPLNSYIPGSAGSLSLKDNADSVTKAELQLEETVRTAKQAVTSAAEETGRLWETLSVSRLNKKIAERTYELSIEGYRAGLVSQTDLESNRQKMVSAQQSVLQAEAAYLTGVYTLANALNLSVDELYEKFGKEDIR